MKRAVVRRSADEGEETTKLYVAGEIASHTFCTILSYK